MKLKPEFRLAKRLKGPTQMDRVIAARAILNGTRAFSKATEVGAFLDIFHPDLDPKRRRAIVEDVKANKGTRT